jgi:hypothetical protein
MRTSASSRTSYAGTYSTNSPRRGRPKPNHLPWRHPNNYPTQDQPRTWSPHIGHRDRGHPPEGTPCNTVPGLPWTMQGTHPEDTPLPRLAVWQISKKVDRRTVQPAPGGQQATAHTKTTDSDLRLSTSLHGTLSETGCEANFGVDAALRLRILCTRSSESCSSLCDTTGLLHRTAKHCCRVQWN